MTIPTPPPPPPASQLPVHSVKQTDAKVAPERLGGSRQETRVSMSFSSFILSFTFVYKYYTVPYMLDVTGMRSKNSEIV